MTMNDIGEVMRTIQRGIAAVSLVAKTIEQHGLDAVYVDTLSGAVMLLKEARECLDDILQEVFDGE